MEEYKHGLPYIDGIYIQEVIKGKMSLGACWLLCVLKRHKNPTTSLCNPSQELLAKEMHKSVRTVQRYIKELVKKGFIRVERQGKMITNKYFFYIDEKLQSFKDECKKKKETAKKIKNKAKKVAKNIKEKCYNYIKNDNDSYSNNKLQNKFCDYDQRPYDGSDGDMTFEEIEWKLLGWS